jgi:hypothetical protein
MVNWTLPFSKLTFEIPGALASESFPSRTRSSDFAGRVMAAVELTGTSISNLIWSP